MSTISTAQRRHSDYYLKKLQGLDLQYRKGGDEASKALTGFISEWDQCKRGQSYAAEWIEKQDWGADLSIGYAIAGTLLLSLRFPPDQRIEWLDSGLRAARLKNELKFQAEIWAQLGSANDALGYWEMSVRLYRESLNLARTLKDRATEGRRLGSLGLVYIALGDYSEAKANLEKALAIAREVGDRQSEGRHLGSLGLISEGMQSIEYFDQALEIARSRGDRDGEISHLGCLGAAWLQNRMEARTRDLMSLPNILMRNRRPDGSVPEYLPDRLDLERASDPLQRAANYFQEAVRIAREIGDYRAEARQLGNLGTALFKQGNIDRALDCFKQALAISEQVADRDNQVKQLENMKSAYESRGNKKEADGIETRLNELSTEHVKPTVENALEKFGSAGVIPFHEKYWRASQEEEYQRFWDDNYRANIGG